MISWSNAHVRAAAAASELQADLTSTSPGRSMSSTPWRVRPRARLRTAGARVGLYLPEKPTPGILLHSGHPRTRQRYTAGHELGHHVFGHAAEADVDLEGALQRGHVNRWPDHREGGRGLRRLVSDAAPADPRRSITNSGIGRARGPARRLRPVAVAGNQLHGHRPRSSPPCSSSTPPSPTAGHRCSRARSSSAGRRHGPRRPAQRRLVARRAPPPPPDRRAAGTARDHPRRDPRRRLHLARRRTAPRAAAAGRLLRRRLGARTRPRPARHRATWSAARRRGRWR